MVPNKFSLLLLIVGLCCFISCSVAEEGNSAGEPRDGAAVSDETENYVDLDFRGLDDEDEYVANDNEQVDPDQSDVDLEAEFHMDDFSPSHVFTFPIGPRQEECFFQDVSVSPTKLRGAYFVESGGSLQLDFTIARTDNLNANKRTPLLKKSGLTENVFTFSAEQNGQYSFCFRNKERVAKTATLAIHVGTKTAEHAKRAHVTPLENAVRSMYKTVKEIVAEQEFFKMRTHRHIQVQDSTDQRVAWYTIFESLFMCSITFGQVYYVRRLINNRQWV